MTNNNINSIVKKLEEMLKSEYGKCEILEGRFSSGEENYHLYKITAPEEYGALIIARDWSNSLYMAQFECADGKVDIFFGFATKQRDTVRWRFYFEDGKYTQGELDDWFLSEQASKTMITLIGGTGVGEDGHEGHYFHTIHRTPESIYGMSKEDAVNEILDAYENAVSEDIVKAAITKQTLMKGDYDMFRFWSGFDLPEPEDDDGRHIYDNCEDYVNSLNMETLISMFDDIDERFNSWCTPSYAMLVEFANLSKEE
jgi:hypothetical protein